MGTFLKAEACLVFLLVYLVLSQARTHGPPECSEKGHVTGRCKASLIRWSFHKKSGCTPFIYGGCPGTRNNFESCEICMQRCKGRPTKAEKKLCKRLLKKFLDKIQPR
uniref:Putative tick kunitz 85 n=1 Tax=Amblyomma triste TaxID=251400 RepID=A0A023G9B4_AMBTT